MARSEMGGLFYCQLCIVNNTESGDRYICVSVATLLDIAEGLSVDLASLVTFSAEEDRLCLEVSKI